ncbi:MAG: mechanosensitive ion channel family protein [Ferrimicrobium sp.]
MTSFLQPVTSSEILVAVAVVGLTLETGGVSLARKHLRRVQNPLLASAIRRLNGPLRLVLPIMFAELALIGVPIEPSLRSDLLHGIGIVLVAAVSWAIIRVTYVVEDVVLQHYEVGKPDNLKARRIYTQIQVFRRIIGLIVVLCGLGVILFSFPQVRVAGTGILASAGIIGLVAGVASKPVATNVIAGMQIAISQPIRVDDVVVVQGHWGRVEEIALTYVVVRVWDLRRLVLPIAYFIENPFENWTRSASDILGWVHLEVDYTAPVQEIREYYAKVVSESPNWDGNVWRMQVTGLGVSTMQLRLLMSSSDSSKSWDLQCEMREKMIAFLQEHYPNALPRVRAEFVPEGVHSKDLVGEFGSGEIVPQS